MAKKKLPPKPQPKPPAPRREATPPAAFVTTDRGQVKRLAQLGYQPSHVSGMGEARMYTFNLSPAEAKEQLT